VHRGLMADDAGLAYLALLSGGFWPCSGVRALGGGERRCACGFAGPLLHVHFCLGGSGAGDVCGVAGEARHEWREGVRRLFHQAGVDSRMGAGPSLAKLARWLGGTADSPLPPQLSLSLPPLFSATFGVWAASQRAAFVPRMFPAAARVPPRL